ncbi:GNAT family N-acetyltransferase [Arthrobacter sp. StoSoilB20]|uniref:GNAT family N-acetyltransferase n=1 Tax=Arthrobacter sp. StoSoilB20 TaxID=2830995 RepID=UPI001CC67675|nr:GNAT family N-acetyltransferase [Arthrobacter sp. StoSoilB20]
MNLTRRVSTRVVGGSGEELHLRQLELSDAPEMAAAYVRNRSHLAPWEPVRTEEFFTVKGQETVLRAKVEHSTAGREVSWVIIGSRGIQGAITLTGIVRGPFQSANLGYWIDAECVGRGHASASVAAVVSMADEELGLHRIQAATLLHNAGSQAVLRRSGFEKIGVARSYLQIAGGWQDHVLFQRILS